MHRTKEQLIGSYIIIKWSKLFHHSLFRCTYACTLEQKLYFLVFFCQVVYVGELTEQKKERNVEWENMRQFSNWLHAVADKNGQLVAGMLQNYIYSKHYKYLGYVLAHELGLGD